MDDGPTYRITGVSMFFMYSVAIMMDALQGLFTFLVFTAPFAELVTFIAAPLFGLWFLIMGVSFFSGKSATSKVLSALGSTVIELVPFLDALPGITIGVYGVISASRKEDREKYEEQRKKLEAEAIENARRVRRQQLIQQAANDNAVAAAQAANDNEESYQQAA